MPAPTPAAGRQYNPWFALFTLCLGFFMILLDTTIVNIAIPDITRRLHAGLDDVLWVLNAYILVYAVLLIAAGRLGDLYGQKRLFMVGLVIFTVASAACGLARNPEQLIAARIVQGVGGALLTPQTLAAITVIFPADKRGAAFGVWGAVAGVAAVAGPTLGGWLVTTFDWRWIFYVNVPVGIAALILATLVVPDLRLHRRHRLDWPGTTLATIGLFLITFALIEGEPHNWAQVRGPVTILMIIAAGIAVLALLVVQQYLHRDREPLVPFSIIADRNFSLMNFVACGVGFAMLGLFVPIVIYLQAVLGLSALQAGLTLAPMSLVSMLIAPFSGRLADRIGGKYLLLSGLSLFAAGMGVLIASSHVGSTRAHLLPGIVVAGFGLGMTFAPLQTLAMHDIKPQLAGAASGLINTTRQLGAVLGSAAVGALLQAQLAASLRETAQRQAGQLPPGLREQTVHELVGQTTGNLQVGSGMPIPLPNTLPPAAREAIEAFASNVFRIGYTEAMRTTLILPIAVLALAALACLFIKELAGSAGTPTPEHSTAVAAPPHNR